MMLLASKGIYFLMSIPEDEGSLIFFVYYRSWCLWSVTPTSRKKYEKVSHTKLGKCCLNSNPIFLDWATSLVP